MLDTSIPFYDFGQYIKGQPDYFAYDLALHCEDWLRDVPAHPQEELLPLYNQVRIYVGKKRDYKPKSFPDGLRTYLFDNRLRTVFTAIDESGLIAHWMAEIIRDHDISEDLLGDIDSVFHDDSGRWDVERMKEFRGIYGFLPTEMLVTDCAVIYEGDSIVESRYISRFHSRLLSARFDQDNLVDWRSLCDVLFR